MVAAPGVVGRVVVEEDVAGGNPGRAEHGADAGLEGLVAAFDREETPYRARPRPDKAPIYDDYEHLARVREWASTDGEDGP